MSPTARRAAPLARPPRRRSHLAWGFSAGCYAERAEQVTVQPVALLRGPVPAPARAVASLPHGTTPLAPRQGVGSDQQEDDQRLQPHGGGGCPPRGGSMCKATCDVHRVWVGRVVGHIAVLCRHADFTGRPSPFVERVSSSSPLLKGVVVLTWKINKNQKINRTSENHN